MPPGTRPPPPPDTAPPPLAAQKFYAAARQALREGDNFRAVQQYEKALRLAPEQPDILRGLGQAWTRSGNRVSAAEHFRRAFTADPTDLDSLFVLGRFALESRDPERAVALLAAAAELAQAPDLPGGDFRGADFRGADPTAARLIRFYLATALDQAGYAAAAAAQYGLFLHPPDDDGASAASRYSRELAVVASQHGQTLMRLGDLYHRLDDPQSAREAYETADRVGVLNREALDRRRLYTLLRLGQTRDAGRLVVAAVGGDAGGPAALPLIRYAVGHGVDPETLTAALRAADADGEGSSTLSLALADVLPRHEAADLLADHLAARPTDDAVHRRLIELLLAGEPAPGDYRRAIAATADAMLGSPGLAEVYAEVLIHTAADLDVLLAAYPAESASSDAARRATETTLRGKTLLALDRADEAFAAFGEAVATDPDQTLARIDRASILLDRGDHDGVGAALGDGLADSIHPRVVELRVEALLATDRPGEALMLLDDVLRRSPPGGPLMLKKAELLLEQGRVADAERTLLDALNARPMDESIYAALLAIYDQNPDMIRNYQRLVRRMIDTIPTARITQLVKAQTLVAIRSFDQARQTLETIEPTDDDRVLIQRLWMEVHVGTNRGDLVDELLQQHLDETRAAGQTPDDELLARAESHYRRTQDFDRWAQVTVLRLPNLPAGFQRDLTLGQAYFQLERYAESAEALSAALDAGFRDDERTRLVLANLLVSALFEAHADRPADAESRVVELADRHAEAIGADLYMRMGLVYDERGDRDASWRVMEAGLERFPGHAPMNNSLGYGLANAGLRLADAERMIARAVAAEPDVAAYLDSMGWVFYKQGRFEEALRWLERGRVAEGGTHPVIIDHHGDALFRLGREAEAVRVWNEGRQVLSAPDYQPSGDPEEQGLLGRIEAKIRAVAEGEPPAIAGLGEGVSLPAAEPLPVAEPLDVEPAVPAGPSGAAGL
ncbi:MAG: tetratricopeptide repeat protein [Planctomycetota bacterium]